MAGTLGQNLAAVPSAANPNINPPQTQGEFDKLKQGWLNFAQQLKTNANLRSAMITMGASLMQPIHPGQQTISGQVGQAMAAGNQAYQAGVAGDQAQAQKQQAADAATSAAKSKAELSAAETKYFNKRETSGAKTSANVALLNEVRQAVADSLGLNMNDPKQAAAATLMAQERITKAQSPAETAQARMIAGTALPGETAAATQQLTDLARSQTLHAEFAAKYPELAAEIASKKVGGKPTFGGDVSAAPLPTPTEITPSTLATQGYSKLPDGINLPDGEHTDPKSGKKFTVKSGMWKWN